MNDKSVALQQEYRLRFEKLGEYRNKIWEILCAEYFGKFISERSEIIDVGAGWGEFINNVKASRKYAIDLNPETKYHLSEDVTFLNQDCSERWKIETRSLDVVFTSNFLEHLPSKEDIERTISEAHRCLRDNGLLICLGPNIKYLPGAYWDFWDHLIPITESSLSELLKLKGFNVKRCIPRFLPFSMSTGSTPPLFMVKLFVRLPILWPLIGRQFLVIGEKKGNGDHM